MSKLNINKIIHEEDTDLTPIELMLEIDENGETTARKLYNFLNLSKGQFARWSKTNIIENAFVEENIDYKGFDIEVEGNMVKDYKLNASFAKKLAMKSNSSRGEQARNYFIKIEDILKAKNNQNVLIQSNQTMFLAQNMQKMASTMSQFMITTANQMQQMKEETKSEVKAIVRDSIIIKDQQIEKVSDMIGLRDKNTKSLSRLLKEKLSGIMGREIMATNSVYKRIMNQTFKEFNVFKWEEIPINTYSKVHAYIDTLEKDDIKFLNY